MKWIYIVMAKPLYESDIVLGYYSTRENAEKFIENILSVDEDELIYDREQLYVDSCVLDDMTV